MRRRKFISLIGGAAAASSAVCVARAQSERVRHIGVLMGTAENDRQTAPFLNAFKSGLQELGWIEGRNIRVDYRFAASDVDRMQRLAKELVDTRPELISCARDSGHRRGGAGGQDPPHRLRRRLRSGRQRICRQPRAPGRQHDRLRQPRSVDGRQMDRVPQGGLAFPRARCLHLQSGHRTACVLSRSVRGRGALVRCAADAGAGSAPRGYRDSDQGLG